MKVFMIGGTGLLGSAAARIFIDRGHSVKSVALPPLPEGAPIPEEMEIVMCNIYEKTDDEIKELMAGCDCFVDERVEFPAPVYDAYYKYNIAPLKRLLPICKELGYKKAVILGSYFSYLAKERPDMKLCEKHPYIRSRIDQENVAFSYADDNFDALHLRHSARQKARLGYPYRADKENGQASLHHVSQRRYSYAYRPSGR